MERLLYRWEAVYSPAPSTTACRWSIQPGPFSTKLTSEPSKINQKRSGASHLLMRCSLALSETTCWIKKLHFKEWQPTFNLRETMAMVAMMMMMMMTSWQSSPRQFAVLHASFCSLQSAGIFTSSLAVIQWDLRMLICTSINSYLRDKSKHVCFFVCVFFFPLFSTPQRHLWALW